MTTEQAKKPQPSDLLTTREARELAGVSNSTILRWIETGLIDVDGVHKTATGRYRIKRWALDSVLEP